MAELCNDLFLEELYESMRQDDEAMCVSLKRNTNSSLTEFHSGLP